MVDTSTAFNRGESNRDKPYMIFDWVKAATIIVDKDIKNAVAGLNEDFEWSADQILKDGKPESDGYSYLSSTWAKPILVDADTGEEHDCYCMEDNNPRNYKADSKWDSEALEILRRGKQPKLTPKKAVPLTDKQVKELAYIEEKPMLMGIVDEKADSDILR
jgi:hypothetical protein